MRNLKSLSVFEELPIYVLLNCFLNCKISKKIIFAGAQSAGCRFNKKPQYRYSGCHAYDAAALNIVLGLYFNFDDTNYIHQERETYFHKIEPDEVYEEYLSIARQNNVTEVNAKGITYTEH